MTTKEIPRGGDKRRAKPHKNATATLMKITTWRSAAERCDNRARDVNGPSINRLRAAAVAAAVHITC
jgi:hypothetical protein